MTLNDAVNELVMEASSAISTKEYQATLIADPDMVSTLAEDAGKLREAIQVVKDSGMLNNLSKKPYESFLETVRERL